MGTIVDKKRADRKANSDELVNRVYAKLTEFVVDSMESNPGDWTKSWSLQASAGIPLNATTGHLTVEATPCSS